MAAKQDPVKLMKQLVSFAAADRVQSGTIVGLGTGSRTAYIIQALGDRLKSGQLKDLSSSRALNLSSVDLSKFQRTDSA
jgi:ribose 5-phosphate isomerase A